MSRSVYVQRSEHLGCLCVWVEVETLFFTSCATIEPILSSGIRLSSSSVIHVFAASVVCSTWTCLGELKEGGVGHVGGVFRSPGGKGTRGQLAQTLKLTPQMVNITLIRSRLIPIPGIIFTLWVTFLFIPVDVYVHTIVHGGSLLVEDRPWWYHWIVQMCERSLDKTTIAQLYRDLMDRRILTFLWLMFSCQFLNV